MCEREKSQGWTENGGKMETGEIINVRMKCRNQKREKTNVKTQCWFGN